EATQIDSDICRQAAVEVLGEGIVQKPVSFRLDPRWIYAGTAVIGCVLVGTILWLALGAGRHATQTPPVIGGSIIRETSATPPAPTSPTSADTWWMLNQDHALAELLEVLGVSYDGAMYPCWIVSKQ